MPNSVKLPLVYAHRGASGDAPENTMSAFKLAIEQGAEGIELDVHMTRDGKIVVIHDETLDRTTTGQGAIFTKTYEEIRLYDASFGQTKFVGEKVPLLAEVLELLAPTTLELNIELKNGLIRYEGMEQEVIRLVREYGMEQRVVFSSFNHYSVVELVRQAPDIESAILYVAGLYEPWNYARTTGARALHPHFYCVVPETVAGAHRAGFKIRPYTVDTERDIRIMITAGVDAIITNFPARMKEIRQTYENSR